MRYQAYAWNGKSYAVMGVSHETREKSMDECMSIINVPNPDVMRGVLKHWKEKPIQIREIG